MSKYDELVAKWSNSLAEKRLLMSQWAQTVVTQYEALPQEVKDELPPIPGHNAQEMIPALYAGTITKEEVAAFDTQYKVLQDFVDACNAKVEALNQSEAVRCKLS